MGSDPPAPIHKRCPVWLPDDGKELVQGVVCIDGSDAWKCFPGYRCLVLRDYIPYCNAHDGSRKNIKINGKYVLNIPRPVHPDGSLTYRISQTCGWISLRDCCAISVHGQQYFSRDGAF